MKRPKDLQLYIQLKTFLNNSIYKYIKKKKEREREFARTYFSVLEWKNWYFNFNQNKL